MGNTGGAAKRAHRQAVKTRRRSFAHGKRYTTKHRIRTVLISRQAEDNRVASSRPSSRHDTPDHVRGSELTPHNPDPPPMRVYFKNHHGTRGRPQTRKAFTPRGPSLRPAAVFRYTAVYPRAAPPLSAARPQWALKIAGPRGAPTAAPPEIKGILSPQGPLSRIPAPAVRGRSPPRRRTEASFQIGATKGGAQIAGPFHARSEGKFLSHRCKCAAQPAAGLPDHGNQGPSGGHQGK